MFLLCILLCQSWKLFEYKCQLYNFETNFFAQTDLKRSIKTDGYVVKWEKNQLKVLKHQKLYCTFVKYRLFAENWYDYIWYMSFSGFFIHF